MVVPGKSQIDCHIQIAEDMGHIKSSIENIQTNVSNINNRLSSGDSQFGALKQEMKDHKDNPTAHHNHPKVIVKKDHDHTTTGEVLKMKWKLVLIIASTISVITIALFASNGG